MLGGLRVPLIGSLSLVLLSACSGSPTVPMGDDTASINSAAGLDEAARKENGPALYVMNSAGSSGSSSITVYPGGGLDLLRTISVGKKGAPSLTVGDEGRLYASDSPGRTRATLRIYEKHGKELLDTWHQQKAYVDLTVDGSGNVYTACGIFVCEYSTSGKILRKFTHTTAPLAVDSSGNIAVSQCGGHPDSGFECIFAPGQSQPYWKAYFGTAIADAGFDPSGNLYVAIPGGNGAVEEFAPNGTTPSRTLTDGMTNPYALAFDATGDVYVLNQGQVTVYPPTGTEPTRSITQGVGGCGGLGTACIHPIALDGSGNLYVANNAANNVTVYAPNGSTPIRTITAGISDPIGLAIGP